MQEELRTRDDVQPSASGWIYTLKVVRQSDKAEFFYVGKAQGYFQQFASRVQSHFNGTSRMTAVANTEYGNVQVTEHQSQTYGIDKPEMKAVEIVSVENLRKSPNEPVRLFKCRVREAERRRSYEVAVEHGTTDVLGGK